MIKTFLHRFKGPLAIYLASRVVILLTVILVNAHGMGPAHLLRWDAKSYLSIATHGYQFSGAYVEEGTFIAFFPLYPLTIHAFHWITHMPIALAGFAVSFIAGAVAICLLYEYIRRNHPPETALIATALLSFFPSSVFLSSLYTEGLFLALVLGVLVALQRNASRTATILTGLALVTRMTGLVLVPILAWHLWRRHRSIGYTFISLAVAAIPMMIFLGFQWDLFGTPFAFLKAQEINWHHHATWPWNGLWTIARSAWMDTSVLQGMWRTDLLMLLMIGGTLIASRRHVPGILFAFGLGAYLLTISQSYTLGIPRYMIVILPYYPYWAHTLRRSPALQYALIGTSAGLMVMNTVLFSLSKNFY